MVVSHNLTALNAQRQFGIINNKKTKSAEKLSSGYRINRAADDAAGLAISEKMRKQIRGLTQGVKNTQDGVSLCQVADGALAEVNDMLHRITELSVKAANDTNSITDREAIQEEINHILEEIDRIGNTTKFNERYLFTGNEKTPSVNADGKVIIGYKPEITTITVPITKTDSFNFNVSGNSTDTSAATYVIDSATSVNTGIIIGADSIPWNAVKNSDGSSVDMNNDIPAGTYSFEHKGMTVSFDTKQSVSAEQFVTGLKNLSWNSKQQNNGSQINYSLTASTSPDYTNTIDRFTLQATDEGIFVNNTLYDWPDSMKNGVLEGNTFNINAGDLQLKISVGTNNTASLSEIAQDIGTKNISETTRTSIITPVSNMSISRTNVNSDIKTTNELISLIDSNPTIKADSDGMWIEMDGKTYRKIGWAELNSGATTDSNGLMRRTYLDGGLRFSFSTQSSLSTDDLAKYINNVPIKITHSEGTHQNVISKTPAETYYGGNDQYYYQFLTYEESLHADLLEQFSFTSFGDGTPTLLPDPDNIEWKSGRPFIISSPYEVTGTEFNKSYQGNYLTLGSASIVTDNFELQNPDELRNYFNNQRPSYKALGQDKAELNLTFEKDNTIISVKMIDDLSTNCTLNEFIEAISDRASYFNEPIFSLVFTESGDDVTYLYNTEVNDKISTQVRYSQYNGTVSSANRNASQIVADSILNVPQYTYQENVTQQQVIQVPIYGDAADIKNEGSLSIWIHSGCERDDGIFLEIDAMNTNYLGINDVDVTSSDGAKHALSAVDGALQKISANRSKIGAQQNRLMHTIENEDNIIENTTSAESKIRDTDMAKEMVAYSNTNILEQVGNAMLAQANQLNQGVLDLLS